MSGRTILSGRPAALTAQVQDFLHLASRIDFPGQLHALIVPHAGYFYSGPIAAYAYKTDHEAVQADCIVCVQS
jgi:AmmeMemoRadiSam system protein B